MTEGCRQCNMSQSLHEHHQQQAGLLSLSDTHTLSDKSALLWHMAYTDVNSAACASIFKLPDELKPL